MRSPSPQEGHREREEAERERGREDRDDEEPADLADHVSPAARGASPPPLDPAPLVVPRQAELAGQPVGRFGLDGLVAEGAAQGARGDADVVARRRLGKPLRARLLVLEAHGDQ